MTTDRAARLQAASHFGDVSVPDLLVARLRRAAASWGLKWAAERLGARRELQVTFAKSSVQTGDVKAAAEVGESQIWIADDLSPADTAGLAAHEAYHCLVDGDEGFAEAIQRECKAAWTAERFRSRDQLYRDAELLFRHVCPSGAFEKKDDAGLRRLQRWYGNCSPGLAAENVRLVYEELAAIENVPPSPSAHLQLPSRNYRAPHPPLPFLINWSDA